MIEKFWRENRFLMKPLVVLIIIYLVGISAILIANVHYADDVARTNYGYAGWSAFSRYASTILSHGIHADNYLTNIAPLPQLLAVVILAVSSLGLICLVSGPEVFKEKWTKWILKIIAVIPLGLCPYMLECLSYQYDAVYMALSVFFAIMPLIFYRQEKWKFALASIVGILGVCTTYQASIGIYPMLVILMAMNDWSKKETKGQEILKSVFISAALFIGTLLFFQKIIMAPRDVYVSNELPGIGEFIPSLISHLRHYFELLINDFKILWLSLAVILMVLFVLLYAVRSKRKKFLAVLVGTIGLLLMTLMTYIFYAALDKPLYTTRAMYAVGALIAIVGTYIVSGEIVRKHDKKYKNERTETKMWTLIRLSEYVLVIPVIILSWCFFSFSFTYGNALHEQDKFRNNQIDMVIDDLNELLKDDSARKIQAVGQIGFAPAIEHMPEKDFYILRRLLKPSYGTDVPWMAYRLTEASGLDNLTYDPNIDLVGDNLPVLKDTALYIIYGDSNSILVKFKGKEFGIWES